MDEKKENLLLGVLFIILILAIIGLVFSSIRKTGSAITPPLSTQSQVVISAHLAIAMSDELAAGIDFGTIETLPAYQNATQNYNASDQTKYSLDVNANSNKDADFCIKADTPLKTASLVEIAMDRYRWSNSVAVNDKDNPPSSPTNAMSLTYVMAGSGVQRGTSNYFRFWLDLPSQQEAGTYTNTIWFQGVPAGSTCS